MSLNHITHIPSDPRQRGSMLLSVLFIMVVLAALMAAIATISSQSSQQLVYEVQALKARLTTESVLEKKMFSQLKQLNIDKVHQDEEDKRLVLNGCTGHIVELDNSSPNKINIIATGSCSNGQLTVIRNIEVEVLSSDQ